MKTVATESHLHVPMGTGNVMKIPLKDIMQLGTRLRRISSTTSTTPVEAPPADSKRQGTRRKSLWL